MKNVVKITISFSLLVFISCSFLSIALAVESDSDNKAEFLLDKMMENRNKVENYKFIHEMRTYNSEKARKMFYKDYLALGLPEEDAQEALNEVYSYKIDHLALDNKGCGRVETITKEVDKKGNPTSKIKSKRIDTLDGKNSIYYDEDPENLHAIIRKEPSLFLTDSYMQPWRTFGGNLCDNLAYAIKENRKVNVEKQKDGKYKIEFLHPEDSKTIGLIDPNQGFSVISQVTYYQERLIGTYKAQFEQVTPGIWFPVSGEYNHGSTTDSLTKITMTVKEIKINDPNFYDGLYHIDFIEGTIINHRGKPGVYYTWMDGKFVDSAGKRFDLNEIGPPPEKVGEPLPDLKDLGINLLPADVNDKSMLVCFFDMEQRPSRNCILQISERAKEIKEKGIVIIAVQASKIEQAKFDEWIKENNIPFPVGMIEGDSDKIRFAWGVRSLPWLILADKKHVVTADGFNIDELDKKIGD